MSPAAEAGLPDPGVIGAIYALTETVIAIVRRSGAQSQKRDRHSLHIVWASIFLAIFAANWLVHACPNARWPHFRAVYFLGLIVFIGAICFRWWAIFCLGRFFTVDVAIARDHTVVSSGPYRLVRHPAYTGALLAFVGWGLCLGNYWALLALTLPITTAFLWRIHVEERALIGALGDDYIAYARRTKRLIPLVY